MKQIFIGSSTEALPQAEMIAAALEKVPGVKPLLWTDAFKTGEITFLAIERVVANVCGAVFVVTPDDESVIRNETVKTPRANVVFEYGYMTSRLTRHRVALCRYRDAMLPSDLAGITHIPMGPFEPRRKLDHVIVFSLKSWAEELPGIQSTLPATLLVHGYSGMWRSQIVFSKWRRTLVKEPHYVVFHADVVLHIPTDGENGRGAITGILEVKRDKCFARFHRSDNIINALVKPDGTLQIRSVVQSRELLESSGKVPQGDGFEQHLLGVRENVIELTKMSHDRGWQGTYTTMVADKTVSVASARFER